MSVISPVAGTRTEPKDAYAFVRGTTAIFKITFTSDGQKTKVDNLTSPKIRIFAPLFLSNSQAPMPQAVAIIDGTLVAGQEFEYQFSWDIPASFVPGDEYIVSYEATLGGSTFNFGDEYFRINASAGQIGTLEPGYATVDDIRKHKFNIDDYLPDIYKKDLEKRNYLLLEHIKIASMRLREELAMFKQRGYSENYKIFTVYYTIYSILLAARGENGSSVADQNIMFWRQEADRVLAQEKREGGAQGVTFGRA